MTEWIVQIRGETEQTDFTQSVGRIVFCFYRNGLFLKAHWVFFY
jgi:hypothetical protein